MRSRSLFFFFLTPSGRVQGLARTQNKMNYMTIAGSDDYMAPEVLLGEKYDEKCDVFGFGVLLGGTVSSASCGPIGCVALLWRW